MGAPLHRATISIPELHLARKRIGGNLLYHLGERRQKHYFDIFPFNKNGYLATNPCFGNIYLALPRCSLDFPESSRVLKLIGTGIDITQVDEITSWKWLAHPLLTSIPKPADILASWKNAFTFREDSPDEAMRGLRPPQVGALHAIAAHLSTGYEPITIVLPTGTGKTEVMLSALIYKRCRKVLVLVPSDILRKQISGKFMSLGCLPEIEVVPSQIRCPRVAVIDHGTKDIDQIKCLVADANVIVATPYSLRLFPDMGLHHLVQECSHLFIDEAHHVAANTWRGIKELFQGKPIIQFTATPFRRDGQNLEGNVAYNYPLLAAQRDGYFKKIRVFQSEDYSESDKAIASKGLEILEADLRDDLDHLLMARVDTKTRAEEVFPIYETLGSRYKPVIIHSSMKAFERYQAIQAIKSRESRVIICVDMLGEGFDFPNLKIAAIHDIHKSLAITLQFVGRFTRTTEGVGDAAVVMNVFDPKVNQELETLYAQDPSWDKILQSQGDKRIQREIKIQKYIDSFQSGSLPSQISLWNLRPAYSTMIFSTSCQDWKPTAYAECLPAKSKHWYALSKTEKTLVVVVARFEEVKWGKYKGIRDLTYELLIAYWDSPRNTLFIYSSDYDYFHTEKLAKSICETSANLFAGPKVFNVFAGMERPMVHNLGASMKGTISFTMFFGPNVTDGLSSVEKAESNLTNLFGWGYEDGQKVNWGCSQRKGKIWSISGGPIPDWREWCVKSFEKISSSKLTEPDLLKGFLRSEKITQRPPLVPISIQWGEGIVSEFEERITIFFDDTKVPILEVSIDLEDNLATGPLKFSISSEGKKAVYDLEINDIKETGYEYRLVEGPAISIQKGNRQKKTLAELCVTDPVIIAYVDGSFSINNFFVKVNDAIGSYDKDKIEQLDWSGFNIRAESQGKMIRKDSIQFRMFQDMLPHYDILFNDDAAGEAADIIGIRKGAGDSLNLCLVHCKFSKEDTAGARIDDLYAVSGQAQKSIRWKHNGFSFLYEHMRKREDTWHEQGSSRFVKGNMKELLGFKKLSKFASIELEIVLVQPGLSKAKVTDEILKLLGSTELFLQKTSRANFRVICSQ